MFGILLIVYIRCQLYFDKISLYFKENDFNFYHILIYVKYRNSSAFLRSCRKFFSNFLTSFLISPLSIIFRRMGVIDLNMLINNYVIMFLSFYFKNTLPSYRSN